MSNGEAWASSSERARLKQAVIAMWGTDCHICGGPITKLYGKDPDSYSIDHVVPRNSQGSNDLMNLRSSHLLCNIKKSDRSMDHYSASHVNEMSWIETLS